MIVSGIFLILVLWTVPSTSLVCYTCNCPLFDTTACNCSNVTNVVTGAHCIITKDFDASNSNVELSSSSISSSYSRIKDPYYIIVDESIFYNETTAQWETKTNQVVYGCDWDNCNSFDFITALPTSFNITIDPIWLNENIYSNQSVNGCYNCSNEICGNQTNPIDYNLCQFTSCNNSITCSLNDLWYDADTNESCYQSECTPQSIDESDEKYKVEVEAIVYLAQNRSNVQIWQLDINCGADNCSRSTIFQEIENQFQGAAGNLAAFPTNRPATTTSSPTTESSPITTSFPTTTSSPTTESPPITASPPITTSSPTTASPPTTTSSPTTTTVSTTATTITCYDCYCYDDPNCSCNTFSDATGSYCTIIRQNFGQDFFIVLEHIPRNSTRFYVREFPYLLVEETILYNETTEQWFTRTNIVAYGCNTNYCNHPSLVPYLPESFQMTLPEPWLNSNVLGTGQPVRNCHECPDAPQCGTLDFLDSSRCPIQDCNTTCLVSDTFDIPENNQQCYQSFCAPPDSEFFTIDPHRVELEGILYLYPIGRQVELWEIDIFCRADNCSRPEIFYELTNRLNVTVGNISIFYTNITTTTSTIGTGTTTISTAGTGTTASLSSSTTQLVGTAITISARTSIYMIHIILIFYFLSMT